MKRLKNFFLNSNPFACLALFSLKAFKFMTFNMSQNNPLANRTIVFPIHTNEIEAK